MLAPVSPTVLNLDELAPRIARILADYEPIAAAYVFGSASRGEMRADSDVDIGLVFRQRGEGKLDHHRMIADLASRLEAVTSPHPVDIVVIEEQGPIFGHRVLLEGRRIYQADEARRVDFESETVLRAIDFRPTYEIAVRNAVDGMRHWLEAYDR